MKTRNSIEMSVIIPVYNVENYLPTCVDSLMQQGNLCLEIILVNDGSTDRSGVIVDQYASIYNHIKVIHQTNRGLSAARNAGLELAQGEYIAFLDSDDWLKKNSLYELYYIAGRYQADVVMGHVLFCRQDGSICYSSKRFHEDNLNVPEAGKECFMRLIKTQTYLPMVYMYIYRKKYLEKIQARFEESIMHEDELWTPPILCQAEKMIIVDFEFYYYRYRNDSILRTTKLIRRLYSLFRVAEKLFEFSDLFTFSGDDGELKNWIYVNIFRIYHNAFTLLPQIKDTFVQLPKHHIDRLWKDSWEMMSEPQKRCSLFFRRAEENLKKYIDWRISEWVASVAPQIKSGRKLMLIYNTEWGKNLSLKIEDVPADWIITTDRRYMQQADTVVFHLPDLLEQIEDDLYKPEGQVWVAWHMEPEIKYPWIKNDEFSDNFDLWMNYRQDADVVYPFYQYNYPKLLSQQVSIHQQRKTCMIISSQELESVHEQFIKELMEYTEIDSYGDLFNNKQMSTNREMECHLSFFSNYKFVLSFEKSIETDYVTGKFYEPLMAGSVPVYLGAPNISEFEPGNNCFVNVSQFETPKLLANFINECNNNEQLYARFFEWKNKPLKQSFLHKAEKEKDHPLVRLCRKISDNIKTTVSDKTFV